MDDLYVRRASCAPLSPQAPRSFLSDRKPRTDFGTILLHWVVASAMITSLVTGLRISADAPKAVVSKALSPVLPQGEIWSVHFVASIVLFFGATAYVAYLVLGGLTGRVALRKLRVLSISRAPHRALWGAVNVGIHWLLYGLVLALTVTGIALYLGYGGWFVAIHAACALATLFYTVAHVLAHFAFGGWQQLLRVFRPSRLSRPPTSAKRPLLIASLIGLPVAFGIAGLEFGTRDRLDVPFVSAPPILDGVLDEPTWSRVHPVVVHTMQGANLGGTGQSRVEVRAVRDAKRIYFAFRWEDPTRSLTRLPLRKEKDGWHLVGEDAGSADVVDFYEDKFAVIFSRSDAFGADGATHLGPRPARNHPSSLNERGLHYTEGHLIDMWQWKSSRGGLLGYMDDQFIGPLRDATPDEAAKRARYQGGYFNDAGPALYQYNFPFEGPGGYKGPIRPKVLPKDIAAMTAALGRFNVENPDQSIDADARWWMTEAEVVPYSQEVDDTIPVGTVMPAVLIKDGFAGDRAHVRAGAKWQDGVWTLEASRELATSSPTDLDFEIGRDLFMWVAVFDHTQTRHTRHMRPVGLHLEP
jgi:Ethylbenzene dehydrogenase/Prokaryotic cytochrome b561